MTIKILTLTSLFPNNMQARHGIFVENRLRHLLEQYDDIECRVVAPVPWFPLRASIFGEYGKYAAVNDTEVRYGVQVYHPRYPVLPKVGMNVAPYLMAKFIYGFLKKIIKDGYDFDLIDAHYFYPDGVAAKLVAEWLGKPFICTARGNDISLLPNYPVPRKLVGEAVESAEHVITVCQALADEVLELGYKPKAISTLRNGVDLTMFDLPNDREALRRQLGIEGFTVISVGHMIERKGHHLVIDAIHKLPDVKLMIAGDGEMDAQLRQQVKDLGLEERVRFLGSVNHTELKNYYGACDALILASSREGWANVLLESMACGTPVVATSIWGTPEVVQTTQVGALIDRDVPGLIKGIEDVRDNVRVAADVRAYAEGFGWQPVVKELREVIMLAAQNKTNQ